MVVEGRLISGGILKRTWWSHSLDFGKTNDSRVFLSRRPMLWTPRLSPIGCNGPWSLPSRCRRSREGRCGARPAPRQTTSG